MHYFCPLCRHVWKSLLEVPKPNRAKNDNTNIQKNSKCVQFDYRDNLGRPFKVCNDCHVKEKTMYIK
jgi:hypothetical protein